MPTVRCVARFTRFWLDACAPMLFVQVLFQVLPSCAAPCWPGSFAGNSGCVPCPAGQFSHGDRCRPCAVGWSSASGSSSCDLCADGEYNTHTGSAGCFQCRSGETSSWRHDGCVQCPVGKFSQVGSPCTNCEVGRYSNEEGSAFCRPCKEGASSAEGASYCIKECAAGQHSQRGGVECTNCTPGRFSVGGKLTSCSSCTAGKYSPGGAPRCFDCPQGTHSDTEASVCEPSCACPEGSGFEHGICVVCAAGRYQHACSCHSCAAGWYAAGPGVTSCVGCSPGRTSNSQRTRCELCQPGRFNSYAGEECLPCSPGSVSPWPGRVRACDLCGSGEGSNGTACVQCSRGFYGVQGVCHPCPQGSISSAGASMCTPCPSGRSANHSCAACEPGWYSSGDRCQRCPAGTHSSQAGSSGCVVCAPNSFSGHEGSVECTTCGLVGWSPAGSSSCHMDWRVLGTLLASVGLVPMWVLRTRTTEGQRRKRRAGKDAATQVEPDEACVVVHGRPGRVVFHHPDLDQVLPYKVEFDDGAEPRSDWVRWHEVHRVRLGQEWSSEPPGL